MSWICAQNRCNFSILCRWINTFNWRERKNLFVFERETEQNTRALCIMNSIRKGDKMNRSTEWMNEWKMDKMSWRCNRNAYIHSVCCVCLCIWTTIGTVARKTNVSLCAMRCTQIHKPQPPAACLLLLFWMLQHTPWRMNTEQHIATPINELGTVFQRQNILRLATMNLEYKNANYLKHGKQEPFGFSYTNSNLFSFYFNSLEWNYHLYLFICYTCKSVFRSFYIQLNGKNW